MASSMTSNPGSTVPVYAAPGTAPQSTSEPTPATPVVTSGSGSMVSLSGKEVRKIDKLQRGDTMRERARWFRNSIKQHVGGGGQSDLCVSSVRVIGYEEHDGITYYRLRMSAVDADSNVGEWDVIHRYSEFETFRKDLGVKDHRVGSIFPQKTGWSKASGAELGKRQQILQTWVDGLITEFSSGGDGRNAMFAHGRDVKLAKLHSFFGLNAEGQLLPTAALVPTGEPLAAATVPSAPPMAELVEEPTLAIAPAPSANAIAPALSANVEGAEDDEVRLEAALAASAEEDTRQRMAEEASLRADIEAALILSEEQERLAVQEEVDRGLALLESKQKAEDEAAMLRAEEEARLSIQAEAAQETARVEAEEVRLAAEETARRSAEEDARYKAEEELEARRQAAEAEAKRKADEAGKSWLEKATDLANQAKQLDDQGEQQQALDQYKRCVAMFAIVKKREKSERIQQAVQTKMQQLTLRADQLAEALAAAEAARAARIMGAPLAPTNLGYPPSETMIDAQAALAAQILGGASAVPVAVPAVPSAAPPAAEVCEASASQLAARSAFAVGT